MSTQLKRNVEDVASLNTQRLELLVSDIYDIKKVLVEIQASLVARDVEQKQLLIKAIDFETRLRHVEQFMFRAKGALAGYSLLGGLVAGVVLLVVQRFI